MKLDLFRSQALTVSLSLIATLCAGGLKSAAAAQSSVKPERIGVPGLYERLYPEYAEFCGLSQIKKKPGDGLSFTGGTGGHGVLYLNGVCKDRNASYPQIKFCDSTDPKDPALRGVGVSVNGDLKNVNWDATPGKRFFFAGDLRSGETVDHNVFFRTDAEAQEMGIMDGVEGHDSIFKKGPSDMWRKDYLYESAMGTDYAISYGRNMSCARIPLSHEQLGQMIAYLNEVNRHYHEDGVEYNWDIFTNNCTHIAHNALAAAGVWGNLVINGFILDVSNFAIPMNTFALLMNQTNDLPLNDLVELFHNEPVRKSLMERNWLPMAPGGLSEVVPMQPKNEIYDLDVGSLVVDMPLLNFVHHDIHDYETEPRYTDVKANLLYFRELYRKLKQERRPLEYYIDSYYADATRQDYDLNEFEAFYKKFYSYLDQQIADVNAKLRIAENYSAANK